MITPDILVRQGTEHGIQAAVFAWAAVAEYHGFAIAWQWALSNDAQVFLQSKKLGVPELHWIHAVPNGGSRGDDQKSRSIRGATMKAEGVREGVADIFFPVARYPYHGLYIEMKTPTGQIRPKQKEFRTFALAQGYAFSFERDWKDAARLVQHYFENTGAALNLKDK
jgi:hypothetical protein